MLVFHVVPALADPVVEQVGVPAGECDQPLATLTVNDRRRNCCGRRTRCGETLDALGEDLLQPSERSERDVDVPPEEERYTYAGGLHAAEHGIIQLAPLEVMIDNADIGGLSTLAHEHETIPGPVWFVHDGIDGGIGFSKAIYEHFLTLTERTREHIADCECRRRRGCPMCVMSEHCGNNNDPLDTLTGTMILDDMLGAMVNAD